MGFVSIGGIFCTLSLCTKTYEGPFDYIMEENVNLGLDTFAHRDT